MAKKRNAAAAAMETNVPEIDTSEEPVRYTEELDEVPVESIRFSPLQYRSTIDPKKLADLAASIRHFGVLERLIVRRTDDGDELIAGERRLRAAKLAGLATVPVTRKLDVPDEIVCEMQVVENTQREDPHPLDDCMGFLRLRDSFGRSPEQIAAKIHRPVGYVYQRLQLEHLCPRARDAMRDGVLGFGVALQLTRIRNRDRQDDATKDLLEWAKREGEVSIARARDHVRHRYMLRLVGTSYDQGPPFDPSDPELVPAAGACSACPRNSDNQRQLFGDGDAFSKEALCSDAACYDRKRAAAWDRAVAEAQAEGKRVADEKESKEIFPHEYGGLAREYVDLDAREYDLGGSRTWRAILGKKRLDEVTTIVVRDRHGNTREVALRKDVTRVIKKTPLAKDPEKLKPKARAEVSPEVKKEREKAKLEKRVDDELGRAVAVTVRTTIEEAAAPPAAFWRALARHVIHREYGTYDDELEAVVRARGLDSDEPEADAIELLERELVDATPVQVVALLGQIVALSRVYLTRRGGIPTETTTSDLLVDALEIDTKAIRRDVAKSVREAERATEKSVAKTPRKPKSRKEIDEEEAAARAEAMEDGGHGE